MTFSLARLAGLAAATAFCGPLLAQTTPVTPRMMIVMDGSGSMWGQIDGTPKLEIARQVVGQVLAGIAPDTELGLIAYGHRQRGQCSDIELMVEPAPGTAAQIAQAVNTMRFQGRTPLTESVRMAAAALRWSEDPATVVLVTDGIETCEADPCALARELEAAGVSFTAHVVGFGLSAEEGAQVSCLAQETGGQYFQADDAAALTDALTATLVAAPEAAPAPVPTAAPAPLPEPEPVRTPAPPASLTAPASALRGSTISVSFEGPATQGDFIDITPPGQPEDALAPSVNYAWVAAGNPASLRVPATPGDYVLRYVQTPPGEPARVLASQPLTVTEADAQLTAPAQAMGGSLVEATWSGPAAEGDYLDLVPAGQAEAGGELDYAWVSQGATVSLRMPLTAGTYEIRYVVAGPGTPSIAARHPLTVTEATATLSAPPSAPPGSEITVRWTGPAATAHYIDLVPAAQVETSGELTYASIDPASDTVTLTLPAEPGDYALRFVAQAQDEVRVLARIPLSVAAGAAPQAPKN